MKEKKESKLKRMTYPPFDRRTISVSSIILEHLNKLMIGRKIKKFTPEGDIIIKKYSRNDVLFDLIHIYYSVVEGIKRDKQLMSRYPFKTFRPYYVVKFFEREGLIPENIEDVDLEVDEDEFREGK